jgi:hypothetical protein
MSKCPRRNRGDDENRGWDVAKYLLGHEREMISGRQCPGGAGRSAAIRTIGN